MSMKKILCSPIGAILAMAVVLSGLRLGFSSVEQTFKEKELSVMLSNLLPGSDVFAEEIYTGKDENIRKVYKGETGFVIEAATDGYVDEIRMLVGVDKQGNVTGLVVREMKETLGLGGNAWSDTAFLSQYLQTSGEAEVEKNIDGITGATVTSKAVTKCVNSASAFVTGADISSGATAWGD